MENADRMLLQQIAESLRKLQVSSPTVLDTIAAAALSGILARDPSGKGPGAEAAAQEAHEAAIALFKKLHPKG